MQLNCKVIKSGNPRFLHQPHPPLFSELSALSSKSFGTPQVTQFLEGPTPPTSPPPLLPFNKEWWGVQLWEENAEWESDVIHREECVWYGLFRENTQEIAHGRSWKELKMGRYMKKGTETIITFVFKTQL